MEVTDQERRDHLHASERAQHERLFRYSVWDADDALAGVPKERCRRVIPLHKTLNMKTEVQARLGVMERGWDTHFWVDYGRIMEETGGNTRHYDLYVVLEGVQIGVAALLSGARRYGRSGKFCSCGRANCLLAEPRLGLSNCLGSSGTPWDRDPNPIDDPGLSGEVSRRLLAACGAVE